MQRYSKQREAIMTYLKGTVTHPTADEVYAAVRSQLPNISLGTVYRNLTQLADSGDIRRLHSIDGVDHFDATVIPHYHFVCRCCNRIYDLPLQPLADLSRMADACGVGTVEGHDIMFYGVCNACKNQNKQ